MSKGKFIEVHVRRDIGADDLLKYGIQDNIADMTGAIKTKKKDRIGDPDQTVKFYYLLNPSAPRPITEECRIPGNWLKRCAPH